MGPKPMRSDVPPGPQRVAVVQMTSTDDVAANIAQLRGGLALIPQSEAVDIVCFPENSLFMRIRRNDQPQSFELTEPIFAELQDWSDQRGAVLVLGSLPYRVGGTVENATVVVRPGAKCEVAYSKIHLFDVDVEGETPVRESDQFVHGREPRVIEVKGWRWGLSICYDLRFPELYATYRDRVHGLMVPSAFLVPTGRAHWEILLRARAIENQAYVVAPAQGGRHVGRDGGERETYGHSMVVDPWGRILTEITEVEVEADAAAAESRSRVRIVELRPESLAQVWKQIPMHQHRRL